MTYYAYNAFLRFHDIVYDPADCPVGCELTTSEPPQTPWPDGQWPYFIDDEWQLVEVQQRLAG
jgi:hypothetical protein